MTSKAAQSVPLYLAMQAGAGIVFGLAFGVVLLATDTGGLAALVLHQDALALATYSLGSAIVLCPLVISTAVGLLAWGQHR